MTSFIYCFRLRGYERFDNNYVRVYKLEYTDKEPNNIIKNYQGLNAVDEQIIGLHTGRYGQKYENYVENKLKKDENIKYLKDNEKYFIILIENEEEREDYISNIVYKYYKEYKKIIKKESQKTNDKIPIELLNIIDDYKEQLIVSEKFKRCLDEIKKIKCSTYKSYYAVRDGGIDIHFITIKKKDKTIEYKYRQTGIEDLFDKELSSFKVINPHNKNYLLVTHHNKVLRKIPTYGLSTYH